MTANRYVPLPTHAEVHTAISVLRTPSTVTEIRAALDSPWDHRGTVRNRIADLCEQGLVTGDSSRPQRFTAAKETP